MSLYEEFAKDCGFASFLNKYIEGEEAINFQIHSKLGDKLTAIFQEVIDFRDNLDFTHVAQNADMQSQFRIQQVAGFCKRVMMPKFIKAVKEEAGFDVRTLRMDTTEEGPTGLYAVFVDFDNIYDSADILAEMTGARRTKYSEERTVAEMREMAQLIDLKTGKLTKNTFSKKNRVISTEVFFDVACSFLVDDFIPETIAEKNRLTARELAGIMMHEIGHMMTIIEHANDMMVVRDRIENFKANLAEEKNPAKAFNMIANAMTPLMEKASQFRTGKKLIDGNIIAQGEMILKFLTSLRKETDVELKNGAVSAGVEADPSLDGYAILEGSWRLFVMIQFTLFEFLVCNFLSLIASANMDEMMRSMAYYDDMQGRKNSDRAMTFNQPFLLERWADEFVSRQGYGAELASGLEKVMNIMIFRMRGGVTNSAWMRHSTIYSYSMQFMSWISSTISVANVMHKTVYEEDYDRVLRLIQNQYAFFKNQRLPPQVVDRWLDNLHRLEETAKKVKGLGDYNFSKFTMRIIRDFFTIPNWWRWVRDGQMEREYRELQNRIDDLRNNQLFADAYRLDQRRRK